MHFTRQIYIPVEAMEGYDLNDTPAYNQQGGLLKLDELKTIICSVCGFILREAMQVTQCGHRFCKHCIERLMARE